MSAEILQQFVFSKARVFFSVLALLMACFVLPSIIMLSAAAQAATITVNSLADPGAAGICTLRDAITSANTLTATNGCTSGDGNDTIQFSVTGTILLASTLPEVTDGQLTINGPASPGITIDGGETPFPNFHQGVQVMQVASGATLNLNNVTVANGFSSTVVGILSSGMGGGILNSGTLIVSHSTLTGNNAPAQGGGIENNHGTLTITDSNFSGNGSGRGGGAIETAGGTLTITNSMFSGNSSGELGGAIETAGGTVTITDSTFSGNNAFGGGGIENGGTLTVTNSTFSGNSAGEVGTRFVTFGFGGAISNSATLIVTNSTFFGNNAGPGAGGGIANGGAGMASVKNTILAHSTNSFGRGPSQNCAGTISDAGYNISDDATCGFAKTGSANNGDGVNPILSTTGLANNGGPTQTIALLTGSPAIDAIPPVSCTDQNGNPLATDQRGFPRPDTGENVCDIGAYEFQDNGTTPAVSITAPAGGATVSGNVSIATQVSPGVSWIDVYIDGSYLASSPPYSFTWDSNSVANGSHTISATAFDSAGTVIGASSITIRVSSVSITAPADGATVLGNVSIATQVSLRVSWIDVYIDGNYLTSSPPYAFTWDSSSVADGVHIISVTAFDGSGTPLGTSSITVRVSSVSVTAPAGGATVSGNVNIATQVSPRVSWIDVYIDGIYLASSPPYSFTWDSNSVANGSHIISATAFDSSGTAISASSIAVNVAN